MDIKQGRRKPFDIEFVEVTEENLEDVAKWANCAIGGAGKDRFVKVNDKNAINVRQTKAFVGDIAVRPTSSKSVKSFSQSAFHKIFEEVKTLEVDRSAETGQFVTHEAALANPETTVHEKVSVELPSDADPS